MVTHLFPQTKFPLHSPGISTRASWHVTVEYVSLLVLLKLVRRHEVITVLLKSLFLFFSILKISILSHYTFPCRISRYRRCWSSIKRKPVVWESQRINEDCWTCWEFVWWWWFWIQFDFNLRGRFLSGTGKIQISVCLLDILLSKAMKLRD